MLTRPHRNANGGPTGGQTPIRTVLRRIDEEATTMLTKTRRNEKAQALGSLQAFRGCDPAELAEVARNTTAVNLAAGRQLCRQGDVGREAFVIEEGEAEVAIDGQTVAILGPGDVVGEMALLERQPRAATVTALTPMRVLVLTAGEFNNVLTEVPTAARRLAQALAGRLREANRRSR